MARSDDGDPPQLHDEVTNYCGIRARSPGWSWPRRWGRIT